MKKVRMILPAIAIMFAIAGALVTNASPNMVDDYLVTDADEINCNVIGKCVPRAQASLCEISAGTDLKHKTPSSCEIFIDFNADFVE
jgi:hypothetical protein